MPQLLSVGLLILISTLACERNPILGRKCGYEEDDKSCSDGRDNDCDGMVDALDKDCQNFSHVAGRVRRADSARLREEIGYELCHDRVDNDKDGRVDCRERTCSNILENCCLAEVTDELCSDEIDNDDNGFFDCSDFGCRRSPFVTVCGKGGTEQYRRSRTAEGKSLETCTDGLDNDDNGFRDCDDFDCKQNSDVNIRRACQESAGNFAQALASCTDGLDNDFDGYVDCEDWDCSFNPKIDVCAGKRVCPLIGG